MISPFAKNSNEDEGTREAQPAGRIALKYFRWHASVVTSTGNRNQIPALNRFMDAQEESYEQALAEIRSGCKESHWMWFIFPQITSLGMSSTAQHYAISGSKEARNFLAHPVLGERLIECNEAVLGVTGLSAYDIFGTPDDMKLLSSATLFAHVSEPTSVFHRVVDPYFDGYFDERTSAIIASSMNLQ